MSKKYDFESITVDAADVINPGDFQSLELVLNVTNATTNTRIEDGKRVYGNKTDKKAGEDHRIQILELMEEGLILEMPSRSCSAGHSLFIEIQTKGAKRDIKLEFRVKVVEAESIDKNVDRIQVELTQFDNYSWNKFCGLFSSRQKEIEDFFEAVKGY